LKRTRRNVGGLSILELIAVIAITALMSALLLPAVQAVREATRRTQCHNNLRQIGVGLHLYEASRMELPPGCLEWRPFDGNPALKNFAWSALIPPFLDQANLHELVDFNVPFDHPRNLTARQTKLSIFLCPSNDPSVNSIFESLGGSDYGGLFGQRITLSSPVDNGTFIHDRSIRLAEISDGLTHTLGVAEDTESPNAHWIDGGNIFEQSGSINDPNAWAWDNEIRSRHLGGAVSLFNCGRTEFLSSATERRVLAAWITRSFGD